MAKKMCICPACKISFDRNSIQAVKVGARRYGHASCYPDSTDFVEMEEPKKNIDADLEDLKKYISTLFKQPNWAQINRQIKLYKNDYKYSYSGIKKALYYFFEIKNGDISKANNSIGIVPFIYQDAYNYYLAIFMAQSQNEEKAFAQQIKEFIIKPKKSKGTKIKILNWGEEEEIDE